MVAGRGPAVRALIADGDPGPAPELGSSGGAGLAPADRVRVVLVDGLGRPSDASVPELARLCADGIDLEVDVGFPTMSLPVQSVLWRGLTQQQSGVQVGNGRRELGGLPARVPGSVAVVESHRQIAGSFGFAELIRPDRRDRFEAAARTAVARSARLVFVHILAVDVAGHRHGAASEAYRSATRSADQLVGELRAAAPDARWFVLADHGHLPAGGHKGVDDQVRIARACIAGRLGDWTGPRAGSIHLVDLARALADSLAAPLDPGAVGRPLAAAIAEPRPGATLPRVGAARWLIGALLVALGLVATIAVAGRTWWHYPVWLAAAAGAQLALVGWPTLSDPTRLGWLVGMSAPAALVAAGCAVRGRADSPVRAVAGQLALPLALLAALAVITGAAARAVGLSGQPALVPYATAIGGYYAAQLAAAVSAAGLVMLVVGRRAP